MTCVCGHDESLHVGDGETESACAGTGPLNFGACSCAGYTVEPRCDFCSGKPAPWTYPTRTCAMDIVGIRGSAPQFEHERLKTVVSVADWAACDECAELIEANDRDALARRLPLESIEPGYVRETRHNLRVMQRLQFFDVRTGPGVRE